jgi:hypothetical protein
MGKIRTRILGLEEVEKKQKKDQKEKAAQKKIAKKKDVSPKPPTTPKPLKAPIAKPRGRRYQEARKLIDKTKTYSQKEAVGLLKTMKTAGLTSQ